MINFNYPIGNGTLDLSAYSAVPQTGKGRAENGPLMSVDIDN